MHDFATRITAAKKIVFTKTLEEPIWGNTEVAKGNLTEEVNKLKKQNGRDIIVYGGSAFVSTLVQQGLIDEFHFIVNPIAIGKGESAFAQLENWQPLKLVNFSPCNSGLVILHYQPKKG
jgi:dihydrofolate reductase